jgi:hypothetical protein
MGFMSTNIGSVPTEEEIRAAVAELHAAGRDEVTVPMVLEHLYPGYADQVAGVDVDLVFPSVHNALVAAGNTGELTVRENADGSATVVFPAGSPA